MLLFLFLSLSFFCCLCCDNAQKEYTNKKQEKFSIVKTLNKQTTQNPSKRSLSKAAAYGCGACLMSIVPYQAIKVLCKTVPEHQETVLHNPKAIPTIALTIMWDLFTASAALVGGYMTFKLIRTSFRSLKEQKS